MTFRSDFHWRCNEVRISFENQDKKKQQEANPKNMGPIASVGMVVAINTSDSTFGWYGKRQGFGCQY